MLTSASMIYLAQRAYHIPYEIGRLAKVSAIGALTYAAMILVAPGSSWQTVIVRLALLGALSCWDFLLSGFYGLTRWPTCAGSWRRSAVPANPQ